jgi:hypothetical protein
MRWTVRKLDHRHARAHAFDSERNLAAKHLGEILRVPGDVIARCIEVVELEEVRAVRIGILA